MVRLAVQGAGLLSWIEEVFEGFLGAAFCIAPVPFCINGVYRNILIKLVGLSLLSLSAQ